MRQEWTPEQDAKLIDLVKDPSHKRSASDIAVIMGRSIASVKHRASRLGYPHVGRAKVIRHSDEFIDQILRLKKEGLTSKEVGSQMGLTAGNVNALLQTRGKQQQINYWTPEEDEWIKVNYPNRAIDLNRGLPGRTPKAIAHRAGALGVPRPAGRLKGAPGKKRVFDEDLICFQYQELKSLKRVADLHGAAETSISAVLKRHDIIPKPYSRFEEFRIQITEDYLRGDMSTVEIGKRYGLSNDRITEGLKELGLHDPTRYARFGNRLSPYENWLNRYGKEEADKRRKDLSDLLRKNAKRGKESPSYDKPSPQGTGNGWKGWYKEHYFRSLREVACMIAMDNAELEWRGAEGVSIPYRFYNNDRTYRPDYIVDECHVIEVKPLKLHNSPCVSAKRDAATLFCEKRGWTYDLIDVEIGTEEIYAAYKDGKVKFDRDYAKRFLDYIGRSEEAELFVMSTEPSPNTPIISLSDPQSR